MTRAELLLQARGLPPRTPGRSHALAWDHTPTESLDLGLHPHERRGAFMGGVRLWLPGYDLAKAWALLEGYRAPSAWPDGWRPRFLHQLAAGRWPILHRVDEDALDVRPQRDGGPTPAAREAAWLAGCPVGRRWSGRGSSLWLGDPARPAATVGRRLGRWAWNVGGLTGRSGIAPTMAAACEAAEAEIDRGAA